MNFINQYNEFCLNYLRCIKKIANLLSLTQSQVLCIKSIPYDGISQNNLAIELSLDLSTLSRNLEKLQTLKIIRKDKSLSDKRLSIIKLTPKGKKIYNKIANIMQNDIHTILSKIQIEDIEYFIEILNKMNWQFELVKNNENC
tara:strand:+ start:293 stop:721 length:429 start_codon:yes stop_codon:yes gene_type:complete